MPLTQAQILRMEGPGAFPSEPNHPVELKTAAVTLNPRSLVHPHEPPVSDLLYSGFLEHVGRCIYGGIVDNPKDPSPDYLLIRQDHGGLTSGRAAWRKDVLDIIGKDGELEIPLLRWPGGNFVSNYHWQDGIGPVELRPKRVELAWLSDESNQFGTNEFVDYCRAAGSEPYICLNMGSGTLEEALAWLEYCNGSGDTRWANLRREHTGRQEPHGIKYWGLGNEIWGPWQVGNMDQAEYSATAKRWAHALRLVDPTIKLVSCGNTGCTDWDREVLQELVGFVDMHSIHYYTVLGHDKMSSVPGLAYEKNVFGPTAVEKMIEVCRSLIDLANVERSMQHIPARNVKIAFDEWNVWDELKAPGGIGLEQTYDYTDMLGFCGWLHVLLRKHKDLGLACLAQTVNVISPVMTTPNGVLFQTLYYPLKAFSTLMKGGALIQLPALPDVYNGPSYPVWIQQTNLQPSYVDYIALATGDSIRLSVINRHPSADWNAELRFDNFEIRDVDVQEIYSEDLHASNTFDHPEVIVPTITKSKTWSGSYVVRKHSWAFFVFNGQEK